MPKTLAQYQVDADRVPLWGTQALAELLARIAKRHGFDPTFRMCSQQIQE
jgi:hypothetical protein